MSTLSRTLRTLTLSVAVLLICLAALAGVARASTPALSAAGRANLEATLEAQMAKYQVPGAVVGMWFPDIGTWVAGSGEADTGSGAAPRPTDSVRIGSVTKSFTATAVLQLVDRKQLALGDQLSKYVPWVPGARRVTVRHLLNMTSGFYNFTDDQAFWDRYLADPTATWRPRQLVRIATAHPAVFPPGREYMYCNTNYILLGMIIERVTGKTARQVITNRIVRRLDLEHTRFPKATTVTLPAPYMHGYMPADGEPSGSANLQDISLYSPSAFWTAGAMVSTVGDLRIWLRAVATGRLLSKRMHAAQLRFSTPNTASYGLGVMNAGVAFGHSGEVPGYNSSMYYLPSLNATSVTLINRYPSSIEGAADQINFALIGAMAGDPNRRRGSTYADPIVDGLMTER